MKWIVILIIAGAARTQTLICKPGSVYLHQDNCNICKCSDDGLTNSCTTMVCNVPKAAVPTSTTANGDNNIQLKSEDGNSDPTANDHASSVDYIETTTVGFDAKLSSVNVKNLNIGLRNPETTTATIDAKVSEANRVDIQNINIDSNNTETTTSSSDNPESAIINVWIPEKMGSNTSQTIAIATENYLKAETFPDPWYPDLPRLNCKSPSIYFHKDGCNICKCSSSFLNSTSHCTNMPCEDSGRYDVVRQVESHETKCDPGQKFIETDSCHICLCVGDTNLDCYKIECTAVSELKRNICIPGETFVSPDGCNICECDEDGSRLKCSNLDCSTFRSLSQIDILCFPMSTYSQGDDDCITCWCSGEGNTFGCTNTPCGPYGRQDLQPVCTPDIYFPDLKGCHICSCNKNGTSFTCANVHCEHLMSFSSSMNCIPNTIFEDDCNICRCSSDGMTTYCSQINCHH